MMTLHPYVADPRVVADAVDLIALYGDDAGFEAAARADHSRGLGNYVHFCRWRQIERLILVMCADRAIGTVH